MIKCTSANESQILIASVGGELIYFELDPLSGDLAEATMQDMGVRKIRLWVYVQITQFQYFNTQQMVF